MRADSTSWSSREPPASSAAPGAASACLLVSAIVHSSLDAVFLLVLNAELGHQPGAHALVLHQLLDLLAEVRYVAQRALERLQGVAQFDHLLELGHLVDDGVG